MSFINLPAVQIPLPGFVSFFLDLVHDLMSTAYMKLETASEWFHISPELYAHLRANAFLLFGVSIIFWPLLLSLITTFTVMGTWTFWLFTTSIFGLLQVRRYPNEELVILELYLYLTVPSLSLCL